VLGVQVLARMIDVCPHCGASIPATRDAFCPQCRRELSENHCRPLEIEDLVERARFESGRHISEYFTIPGRILVLTTVVLAAGGPWLVFMWLRDSLTPGSYPLWFFALPIWIALAFIFALATIVLRRFGVPIIRQSDEEENSRSIVNE